MIDRNPAFPGAGLRGAVALALAALLQAPVQAQAASTTYSSDTTWRGEVDIGGPIVVDEGATLTIEPGTVVAIHGYWDARIFVLGRLNAVGTDKRPIRFDVGADNAYWSGITFRGERAGGSVIGCEFKNGRFATITCDQASPEIRDNSFVFLTYGGSGVLCLNGSRAIIEHNFMIGGVGAGVLVVQASPVITDNTFKGFAVGVQVSDRGLPPSYRKHEDAIRTRSHRMSADRRPQCGGNRCDDGVELFDERQAGATRWREIYASGNLEMHNVMRRFEIVRADPGDTVRLLTAGPGSAAITRRYTLSASGSRLALIVNEARAGGSSPEEWNRRWPYDASPPCVLDGQHCRLRWVWTVLAQIGAEGSDSARPSHVLLLNHEPADSNHTTSEPLWASPAFDRGEVLATTADLDGDGTAEIVVATGGLLGAGGKLHVFRRQRQ